MRKIHLTVAMGLAGLLVMAPPTEAQGDRAQPGGRNRAAQRPGALNVAEVERLFDGYVAMQAQDALKLTDAQFPQFLTKLKVLQRARRQHVAARRALVAGLAEALKASPPAEGAVADGLRKVRDLDGQFVDELRKAYDGIDEVLDLTQQARFRVFEEAVERRKIDLMLRARRTAQRGDVDRIPVP